MTPFWRLGISNMIFYLCSQFSTIFINIYVFQQFHSLQVIGTYNAILYSTWILAFTLGTKLCAKSIRINFAIAAVVGMLAVAVLLVISPGILWLDLLVGGLVGVASGFYYVSYNAFLFALSNKGQRGHSIARLSILTSIVSMMMPAVSGFLVQGAGFHVAFLVVIGLYLLLLMLSLRFTKENVPAVSFRSVTRIPAGFGTFSGAIFATSVYSHFLPFAAGILTFSFGSGIRGAGLLNTMYALMALLSYLLIGYGIRSRADDPRQRYGWIGAVLATGGTTFLFGNSLSAMIAFNTIVSIANPLFFSLVNGQQFDAVGRMYKNPIEGFLVREWLYTFARVGIFAYVGVFGLSQGSTEFMILGVCLMIAPLAAVWLNRRIGRGAVRVTRATDATL